MLYDKRMSKRCFKSKFLKLYSAIQVRRVREKSNALDFYTGSLKPELHLVGKDNLRLTFQLFRKMYKFYNTILSNYAKTRHNDSLITQESH